MSALHGVGVLVTRPEHQAMPLCRLLEMQGATTLRLPAVEIKACGNRRDIAARLGALEEFDLIVFTSSNAVRFGAPLLDQKRDLTLAAIGPATARALDQGGYRVAVQPQAGFDSESLLKHPRLEHAAGRRILIIKGSGGRPLLEQELMQRGAQVSTADVYHRVQATPDHAALAVLLNRFTDGAVQVITATSLEIGSSLLGLAPPALREQFEQAHWLVPGERIAAGLRERGLSAPLLQAESAEDHDLVAALIRWRSSVSGA
ncbi:MAG TPA: uroporphyrinogen-III synthase [Steroidobacteraceae bacterium]